jgi:hypothetical protein
MVGWGKRDHFRKANKEGVTETGEAKQSPISTYSKYGAKVSVIDGIKFDSNLEVRFYTECQRLVKEGLIADVKAHADPVEVVPAQYVEDSTRNQKKSGALRGKYCLHQSIVYNPDFVVTTNSGKTILIDTKSFATVTDSFIMKVKLLWYLKGIDVAIITIELIPHLAKVFNLIEEGEFVHIMTRKQLLKFKRDKLQVA